MWPVTPHRFDPQRNASAIHGNGYSAHLFHGQIDCILNGSVVRHIGLGKMAANFCCDLWAAIRVPIQQGHLRPFGRKIPCRRLSEARGTACYNRFGGGKLHGVAPLISGICRSDKRKPSAEASDASAFVDPSAAIDAAAVAVIKHAGLTGGYSGFGCDQFDCALGCTDRANHRFGWGAGGSHFDCHMPF